MINAGQRQYGMCIVERVSSGIEYIQMVNSGSKGEGDNSSKDRMYHIGLCSNPDSSLYQFCDLKQAI